MTQNNPPESDSQATNDAPQRPLRIGRGGKYYEVLYVGGVAQERRLNRKGIQESGPATRVLDNGDESGQYQVLHVQGQPESADELQPQPSVRRRRSRQGLVIQPTPPLRRLRPGSVRSKESTPSQESGDNSISEESCALVRESSLGIVPEQEAEAAYNVLPVPVPIVTLNVKSTPEPLKNVPIYDKPGPVRPVQLKVGGDGRSNSRETSQPSTNQIKVKSEDAGTDQIKLGTFNQLFTKKDTNPESKQEISLDDSKLLKQLQLVQEREKQLELDRLREQRLWEQQKQQLLLRQQEDQRKSQQRQIEEQERLLREQQAREQEEILKKQKEQENIIQIELQRKQQEQLLYEQQLRDQLLREKEFREQEALKQEKLKEQQLILEQQLLLQQQQQQQQLARQQQLLLQQQNASIVKDQKMDIKTTKAMANPYEDQINSLLKGSQKRNDETLAQTIDSSSVSTNFRVQENPSGQGLSDRDQGAPGHSNGIIQTASIQANNSSEVNSNRSVIVAPVGHREFQIEPSLGTMSPESLKDWYEDEDYPFDEEEDATDLEGNAIKRKPSKIIRKIQGLFEKKKPDDSLSVTETKNSGQLLPPPSPREPTTPTKKSKLGQFFSFKKEDKRKASNEIYQPMVFEPAIKGPDIPDGMLTKVFMSKLAEAEEAAKTQVQQNSVNSPPPVLDWRNWSPSCEDLTAVGKPKKEEMKPSKFSVPEIPPFQPKSQEQTPIIENLVKQQKRLSGLMAPESSEVQNSPYSICRNRGSVKGPRRLSIANDDQTHEGSFGVNDDRTSLAPEKQKPLEVPVESSTFVRKPSKKAQAIPPEMRAPIYKPSQEYSTNNNLPEEPPQQKPVEQPATKNEKTVKENEEGSSRKTLLEENRSETEEEESQEESETEPANLRQNHRGSIQELQPLFKQAWMLIRMMVNDIFDGVPKEVWNDLRVLIFVMIAMLACLHLRGFIHFNGSNPLALLKILFRGLQIFLGTVIYGGLALYDALDELVSDASTNLVADTLNEI